MISINSTEKAQTEKAQTLVVMWVKTMWNDEKDCDELKQGTVYIKP